MTESDHWIWWQEDEEAEPAEARPRRRQLNVGMRQITGVSSGFGTFVLVNAFMMYSAFQENIVHGKDMNLLAQAVGLIVLAFGLGGFLAWRLEGFARLYGIGLMTGWTFMTLFSLGFCTGLSG
jgi:hypothetical protein